MDAEKLPFIASREEEGELAHCACCVKRTGHRRAAGRVSLSPLFIHVLLLLSYTAAGYLYLQRNLKSGGVPNDLGLHLPWTQKWFVNTVTKTYSGSPTDPSVDEAWHNLLDNIHVRVTDEELKRTKQHSIALPEGGHLAWFGVTHELHCVKELRHAVYREHYHPNMTETELFHRQNHLDHCLEYLRQSSMCHGDMSLTAFRWNPAKDKPEMVVSRRQRTCVNWNELQDSVRDRFVGHEEMKRLENPLSPHLESAPARGHDSDDAVEFDLATPNHIYHPDNMDSEGEIVYPDSEGEIVYPVVYADTASGEEDDLYE